MRKASQLAWRSVDTNIPSASSHLYASKNRWINMPALSGPSYGNPTPPAPAMSIALVPQAVPALRKTLESKGKMA
ncbi:hypothetical protein B0H19DRAFT_1187511 [Mycena capillaripes]|nr:hypothetical protein B0H19DRAFT_1187511 [Mycena capillaripes]